MTAGAAGVFTLDTTERAGKQATLKLWHRSTIDDDCLPGDERRGIRAQEFHDTGRFRGGEAPGSRKPRDLDTRLMAIPFENRLQLRIAKFWM